jgi:hypothetical protein
MFGANDDFEVMCKRHSAKLLRSLAQKVDIQTARDPAPRIV